MTTVEENIEICVRLLGWHRGYSATYGFDAWIDPDAHGVADKAHTPTFTTWAEAGLILDAFKPIGGVVVMYIPHQGCWSCSPPGGAKVKVTDGETGPLAIRAAALEYIRNLP